MAPHRSWGGTGVTDGVTERGAAMAHPVAPVPCTVLLPAYNEEQRIEACLEALRGAELPAGHAWRRWLLLDDSTDSTTNLARQWAQRHPEVPLQVDSRPFRTGKAARLGEAHAQLLEHSVDADELVLVVDGDALVRPGSLGALLAPFAGREGAPVVVWGSDHPDTCSLGRWASAFQMEVTQELGKRVGPAEPRAYGRFFAYRLVALKDFRWQPSQVDDLQLAAWAGEHRMVTQSAWHATVSVAPARGYRDFYLQTYRYYNALAKAQRSTGGGPIRGSLGAAWCVARRHPPWGLAYLTARAVAALQHRVSRGALGPLWEPASTTKEPPKRTRGGRHDLEP